MDRPSPLRRIAVIGAGQAGLDFSLRCLEAGLDVDLEDVMPSRLHRAEQAHAAHFSGCGPGVLRLAHTVEDAVRTAELAIDFVPDELESKLEIFSMLDRMAPPHTIFCTPTSTLSIADLASCTYRPERCFAVRFGQAGPSSALLVRTLKSEPSATIAVEHWLRALGFVVKTVEDDAEPMLAASHRASHQDDVS